MITNVTVAVVVTAESEMMLPSVGPVLSFHEPSTYSGRPCTSRMGVGLKGDVTYAGIGIPSDRFYGLLQVEAGPKLIGPACVTSF